MAMMPMLLGAGAQTTVSIPIGGVSALRIGAISTAEMQYNLDGKAYEIDNGGVPSLVASWVVPNGLAGLYEIRVTKTAGAAAVTGSALATWLPLTGTRTWQVTASSMGVQTATVTVEIRLASTLAVVASRTGVSMDAEWA